MYNSYVFDLYGTLIDISTNEHKDELWEKMAVFFAYYGSSASPQILKKQYFDTFELLCKKSTKDNRVLYPEAKAEDVISKIFEFNCGTNLSKIQSTLVLQFFRILATEHIKLYNGCERLLNAIKRAGKRIYLLSNAQSGFTMGEIEMLGLSKYFNGILLSSDVGCVKPDRLIYSKLIKKFDLKTEDTLFIGNDLYSDILGANQFGFDTVFFNSYHNELSNSIIPTYAINDGDYGKLIELLIGTLQLNDYENAFNE